jgi:acetolactate synthase-1/3 small subunit
MQQHVTDSVTDIIRTAAGLATACNRTNSKDRLTSIAIIMVLTTSLTHDSSLQVRCTQFQRTEIKTIAEIFGAKIAQLTLQTMTLEVIGNEDRMRSVQEVLAPYGIIEFARTGRVALERNSKVDSKLLQRSNLGSV